MCQNTVNIVQASREAILSCHHTAVHISTVEGADAYKCNDCGVRLTINFVPIISGEEWGKCQENNTSQ